MAHEYSVEIQDYLTKQIKRAKEQKQLAEDKNEPAIIQFHEGYLEELYSIRKYITDQIDLTTQKYY